MIYQVLNKGEWVNVDCSTYETAEKQGYSVRKSENGHLWTIPGPPFKYKDI